jgi:hypothetical protein
VHRVGELALVLDHRFQTIEPCARLVLDERTPQLDQLLRRLRRRQPGQALTHHHRQRIGQRCIGAVGDLVEFAAMEMIVEHRGQVLRNTRHPPRADRLDARLLDGVEHAARLHVARHLLAMHRGIVTSEPQRDRIGMAADDRRVLLRQLARRLRQPRLAGRKARTLGRKRHLKLG